MTQMQSDLPLFYKNPVLLRLEQHRNKALRPANGYGFSATTNAVPLLINEFAHAVRHYPIVFTGADRPTATAVLGLKGGQNLFVATNGAWRDATYVPAYLRRYPFIVTDAPDGASQLLAIDAACERFTDLGASADARPLFNDAGGPAPAAGEAMAFCHAFHQGHLRGEGFGRALLEQGLLVARHADMRLPDGSRHTLDGFMVVDMEKFLAVSDAELLRDWHAKGWLAAINLHWASMLNWETLLLVNQHQQSVQGAA